MKNYSFENLLNKCRCCFQIMSRRSTKIEITDRQRQDFFNLTQIELKMDPIYSNFFCNNCDELLKEHVEFKLNAIQRQEQMYRQLTPIESIKFEPKYAECLSEEEIEMPANSNNFQQEFEQIILKTETGTFEEVDIIIRDKVNKILHTFERNLIKLLMFRLNLIRKCQVKFLPKFLETKS